MEVTEELPRPRATWRLRIRRALGMREPMAEWATVLAALGTMYEVYEYDAPWASSDFH